ncbi:MAG TPA: LD-carboxypeptidase [Streptosporangiaceae bacterium]|nr:LD-carboxypeptidase [Streptosporangiaceae bacterium]
MSEPVSLARPTALKTGDRVAVLCVSSPVEPEALAAGLDALRFAGLEPVIYPSAHDPGTMRPYLAGDDAMRAGDLRSALTDPGIAGILFARGGSGAQRTLEAMDWDGLAGMPPKVLAGTFTGCGPPEAIQDILAERLGSLGVPMIAWANVGHGGLFQAFPYGIAAELDAGAATLRLLDPPLS